MIVGNGDIASALRETMRAADESYIFFASGVSNSQEKREKEFARELDLLLKQDKTKHLVYFSSLCVFYGETRYSAHKRSMETVIHNSFPKHTIVRIGNITWGDNPNTLINFFRNKIAKGEKFEIRDVYRYVVDKDEFIHWMNMVPEWSCEFNITGKFLKVHDIVNQYGYVSIPTKKV